VAIEDGLDDWQTQPRALTFGLGRIEGLEYELEIFVGNTDLDEIAQKKLPFHQLLAFGQSFLELLLVAFRLATGTSCGWSGWPKSWGCLYPGKRPVTG
jgi:hypothetical protein